jgi:hypothetical protein
VVDTFGSYAFDFLQVSKQPKAAVAVLHCISFDVI